MWVFGLLFTPVPRIVLVSRIYMCLPLLFPLLVIVHVSAVLVSVCDLLGFPFSVSYFFFLSALLASVFDLLFLVEPVLNKVFHSSYSPFLDRLSFSHS